MMITEETIRIYNKTLEPNLWDEKQNLQPEIRLDLLKIAKDFYKSTDFKTEIIDILLLGSSINYNWTPESDIDVHIIIDVKKEGLDSEHYRKFLDSLGSKWNQEHDVSIKGHKVEVYLQDITEKNSTIEKARKHASMFSLLNNKWLISPKYEKITLDKDTIKKEFYKIKDKIDVIIKDRNIDGLKDLMKSIRDYRNKGLEGEEGEFSTENIVFKSLRHTGMLEKLKTSINSIYDRMVSIKETEKYLKEATQIEGSIFDDIIIETIEIIEEEMKPYILVGSVDDNLYVAGIKQSDQTKKLGLAKAIELPQNYVTHRIVYGRFPDLDFRTAVDWRYRSDSNELVWIDYPSEKQSQVVRDYLKTNYGIDNPKYMVMTSMTTDQHKHFHNLNFKYKNSQGLKEKQVLDEIYDIIMESDKNNPSNTFIVTGRVSHDLDVNGEIYKENNKVITHGMLKQWYGNWADSIDWRYRADENVVYYLDREPNDDQKEVIFDFLRNRFGVNNRPSFVLLRGKNNVNKSHFPRLSQYYKGVDENIDSSLFFF